MSPGSQDACLRGSRLGKGKSCSFRILCRPGWGFYFFMNEGVELVGNQFKLGYKYHEIFA